MASPPSKRPAKRPTKKAPAKQAPRKSPPPPAPPPPPSDAERLSELRTGLIDDAHRLRDQIFHPTVRHEVKVTGLGEGVSQAEVIEVHLDEPTFADKKLIVTSIDSIIKQVTALTPGQGLAGGAPPADPDGDEGGAPVSDFERAKQEREARRAAAQAGKSP